MFELRPDNLGRVMSQSEKTAYVHYLSSVARGNTELDAAQHASHRCREPTCGRTSWRG